MKMMNIKAAAETESSEASRAPEGSGKSVGGEQEAAKMEQTPSLWEIMSPKQEVRDGSEAKSHKKNNSPCVFCTP